MAQSLYVTNLVGTTFFKCSGNVVKAPDSTALKDLIDHLSFVRVSCTVNGKLVNSRIKQSPFHTQFCLKLPQSSYDKATDKVTSINTPVRIIGTTLKPTGITAGKEPFKCFYCNYQSFPGHQYTYSSVNHLYCNSFNTKDGYIPKYRS